MSLMQKNLGPRFIAAAALCISLCCPCSVFAEAAVGDALPAISLVNVDTGQPADLGGMIEGSVATVVYMQTSCAVCRRELKVLSELTEKLSFKIVAISVDASDVARVVKYKDHFKFNFPFLHDPEFKTPELFGFAYTPAMVLVGKDGKIAQLKGGFRPGDEVEIEKAISELLGK